MTFGDPMAAKDGKLAKGFAASDDGRRCGAPSADQDYLK